ncbi:MAG TPA: hypothetical protein VL094_03870 [Sphingomonadaceae bacterium]|nr:hypothetical protein [Sphingomonadaceae bacterium]
MRIAAGLPKKGRRTILRLLAGGLCALAVFAALPHWLGQRAALAARQERLHGTISGRKLVYAGATLGDAIDDLNSYSDLRVVTLPQLRLRGFSGELPGPPGGMAAARELERQSGLRLVRAGPHWALVEPEEPR